MFKAVHVPSRTVTCISAETVIELSQIDNIVGLKEASGDLGQAARILDGTNKDSLLYSGGDRDTFPLLSLGAYGAISVASHLVGTQVREMISRTIGGEIAKAAALHRNLLPLFNALFVVSNPIPVKHALNYVVFPVGEPRLPLIVPDEKSAATIEAVVKKYHIALPFYS